MVYGSELEINYRKIHPKHEIRKRNKKEPHVLVPGDFIH
jgi:hypothetical protein